MTDQPNGKGSILSLDAARSNGIRKGNDFITVQQAYDMVIQECAKVHQFYLEQIPNYTARMIQDALLSYGLIAPLANPDIGPASPVVESTDEQGETVVSQGENGGLMVTPE